jgi:2-polyprenyl-3-methyl-5-hydroxy-6-metoxy-1,4-benzoquinol methylase
MDSPPGLSLKEQFGQIDIYLFDQILRGNIAPGMRIVDAGCGGGRNLVYLLRAGYDVYGFDQSAEAIEQARSLAASLQPNISAGNFRVACIEQAPFADDFADVVICSAVLHFSRDDEQFSNILRQLWRIVKPGGMLFCRLGSRIGMEFERVRGNIYRTGQGAAWYLVDEEMLMRLTAQMNGELVDPIKTTVVQRQRCMTTWVLRKR